MPITPDEINFYLSGGAANSDPNSSLGGVISSTEIVDATLDNLFDTVTSSEATSGDIEYRCFYVQNDNVSLTLQSAVVWIQVQTASPDTSIAISVATEGVNNTVQVIPTESTAPVGQVFTQPSDEGTAIAIGDIPAGQFIGIWVQRTVDPAATAYTTDTTTIRVKGETA